MMGRNIMNWLGCLGVLLLSELVAPIEAKKHHLSSSLTLLVTSPTLQAGHHPPKKIEPPTPKFKTTPDKDAGPELDLNVLSKKNLSSWDDENMVLTTSNFMPGMYQTRIPVGNGYFGTTMAAAGPFFEMDVNHTNHDGNVTEGWPLFNARQTFATISGFFDVQETTLRANFYELQDLGWESVISGIPYPLTFGLKSGENALNSTVDAKNIRNYTQTWNIRDGLIHTIYAWTPQGSKVSLDIEYMAFSSRAEPNVGSTQLRVTPRGGNYNLSVIDLLDGRSAQRSHLVKKEMLPDSQIYVGLHPEGLPNVTAYIFSTANVSNGYTIDSSRRAITSLEHENGNMTIGQEWDVQLIDGETALFQKFIGLASVDKFEDPQSQASTSSSDTASNGWDATLSKSTNAWNKLMDRNLITDYRDPATRKLPENDPFTENLQAASVVDRHMSLINLLPEDGKNLNDVGISPVGMSADSYGGMIFWDQDLWVFPAMAASNPEYALQIPKSRVKLWEQAKRNTQMDYVKKGTSNYTFDEDSVLYPWMNGRYGNATATGPAKDYQYHLNTDIALSMLQTRRITGNETMFRKDFWPVVKSVSHTIATLLRKDGIGWSIFNVTDPDEYASTVDNGAYVLSSMSAILHQTIALQKDYGEEVNQTWIDMANNVNIPRAASSITQEYQNMPGDITVKQADVSLMSYPWSYAQSYSLEQKRTDLDFYAQKQNPDGPAMTYAINAIVENQIAESGCSASTYHYKATMPYLRAPWLLMSEVPNDDLNGNGGVPPAFPFVTGHGGAAQIPLFGLLGLDLTQDDLTIQPSLPFPHEHVSLPAFYFQGGRFKAAMNSTYTNLTRLPSKNTSVIHDVYAGRLMPVVVGNLGGRREQEFYNISVGDTLTIANDMYWKLPSMQDNVAQCLPTYSESDNVLGSWPGAATDGNPSTRWQPKTTNATSLIVDMSEVPFQPVSKINIDWAARPAQFARVVFTNNTVSKSLKEYSISDFYNAYEGHLIDLGNIQPSQPHHTSHQSTPVSYVGNRTEYDVHDLLVHGKRSLKLVPVYTGKYAILEIEGCKECGSMNSWTGGEGTMFNPQENTFGATVGEVEIIGMNGTKVN